MLPRLVPEISPLDAICDVVGIGAGAVGVVLGIGDSRSWMDVGLIFFWCHIRVT